MRGRPCAAPRRAGRAAGRRARAARKGWAVAAEHVYSDDGISEAPALRIVSDEKWAGAHERLDRSRDIYVLRTKGKLWGRPMNGMESKYLMTGLLTCGACGGNMVVVSRDMKRYRKHSYVCSADRFRGTCSNNLWAPLEVVDQGVLSALEQDLLTPAMLDVAVETAMAMLKPDTEAAERRRKALLAEQAKLEAELGRLTDAVIEGGDVATLVKAIKTREARKSEIETTLSTLAHVRGLSSAELEKLQQGLRARLDDWRGLLRRQPIQGRQILRKLLVGRLTLTPRVADGAQMYEYAGEATLGRLLAGSLSAATMVTPEGQGQSVEFEISGMAIA